jgi:hypothetical protein
MSTTPAAIRSPSSITETFVGEPLIPQDQTFSTAEMAQGSPGLPRQFSWRGRRHAVLEILEEWKEAGDCRHGSGERYVRKHWFRIRTVEGLEMKIYFERQRRTSGGSRWRLYSLVNPAHDEEARPAHPVADRSPG